MLALWPKVTLAPKLRSPNPNAYLGENLPCIAKFLTTHSTCCLLAVNFEHQAWPCDRARHGRHTYTGGRRFSEYDNTPNFHLDPQAIALMGRQPGFASGLR